MRQVQLAGRTASAIGFGCANLMGRHGRKASLEALNAAFDGGVNYFDSARSYGYGKAEGLLGEFLVGKRSRVMLATKFGILPPKPSLVKDFARPIARTGLGLAKRLGLGKAERLIRGGIAAGAGTQVVRGQFSPAIAKASLEQSLKELRTDHVDILWLHACGPDDLTEELRGTLDGFVKEGKIRHYGPATDPDACKAILYRHPDLGLVQVPNSVLTDGLHSAASRAVVTHSAFGQSGENARVREACAGKPECADLPRFFLRYALAANPHGVVVLGMHGREHIAANLAAAAEPLTDSAFLFETVARIRAAASR